MSRYRVNYFRKNHYRRDDFVTEFFNYKPKHFCGICEVEKGIKDIMKGIEEVDKGLNKVGNKDFCNGTQYIRKGIENIFLGEKELIIGLENCRLPYEM